MRVSLLAFTAVLAPVATLADVFVVESAPTAATVYAQGAEVTRTLSIGVTPGTHQIVLPDLPRDIDPSRITASLMGARLDSVTFRDRNQPPIADLDTPAIIDARTLLDQARDALAQIDDQIARQNLRIDAARAQTDFLTNLGGSEALPQDVDALRALAQMIGDQTFTAAQTAQDAREELRGLQKDRKALVKARDNAQAALDALLTADDDRTRLTLTATTDDAGPINVTVTYPVFAAWQPTYTLRLDTDTPGLALERGARVAQSSGEDWTDIALTLSTTLPTGQTAPGEVRPWVRRIFDKVTPKAAARQSALADEAEIGALAAPVAEESVSFAAALLDGPSVRYVFPTPITVANDADNVRIALDTLNFAPDIYARAVPLLDETAYRMARFSNTTRQQLLASFQATAIVDGQFIGEVPFPAVAPGQEIDLPFGPIETLRLDRVRLDRNEGDRGLITRSNEITENTRIDIENTGGDPWRIELIDRVPVTEQEDLVIDWTARPAPTVTDHDDRRGVLMWDLTLAPGAQTSIALDVELNWPKDKLLR